MSFLSREGTPNFPFFCAPLQKPVTRLTKGWNPSVFEGLPSMDEYEKTFKRDLVQTLGIISSEFSSRIKQEECPRHSGKLDQLLQMNQEQIKRSSSSRGSPALLLSILHRKLDNKARSGFFFFLMFEYSLSSSHFALQLNPRLKGMTKGILLLHCFAFAGD